MLVSDSDQLVKTPFDNEAEIEAVVQKYSEQLFGSSCIYLPKRRLTTVGGSGTVPDAIVIDVEGEEWFLVEAERAVHGTWNHIAPQVSRQLAAVASTASRGAILNLALDAIRQQATLRGMFGELGIADIEIHGRLQGILDNRPTVAIPIDSIPNDLTEWAQTLRNTVKIWVLEKFVSINDPARVVYSIPDENVPTMTTTPDATGMAEPARRSASESWRELLEAMPQLLGQRVHTDYGPRGAERKRFFATIREEGIEFDGAIYSPSYAAVACMRRAGGERRTSNGWLRWKVESGETLNDLYQRAKQLSESTGEA